MKESYNYDTFSDCDCTFISPLVTDILSMAVNESDYDGLVVTSKRSLEALNDRQGWRHKKLFVVGPATKAMALEMGFVNILGAESGSAAALVDYILKEKNDRLLVLIGDKNRDDLSAGLREAGIMFDQLQVYATNPNPHLEAELSQLRNAEWIVFFSPSGFDAVNVFIKEFPKIACIGRTTAGHITNLGYSVTAVAQKPDPISLFNAIFKEV